MTISMNNRRIRPLFAALVFVGALVPMSSAAAPTRETSHAWVDVNTNDFAGNIRALRKIIGSEVQICPILKANAYGCGIAVLVPELNRNGISSIGIAGNDDALAARNAGFINRILRVRLATAGEIREGFALGVEELVGSLAIAREANRLAATSGRRLRVHLALNAGGMDRNGLDMSFAGSLNEAVAISRLPNLEIVGIMTHYPVEEEADIRSGLARFKSQSAAIIKATGLDRGKITLHTANSFAALNVPESRLDMIRPGSLLLQHLDDNLPQFKTIFSFKTRVSAINSYPKGSTVCYDRTYTLTRDSRLANLPVGYSDGYLRVFGNKGHVLINGHRIRIVGNITMNTCMVDVTDFPDVKVGDEVVLFGSQGSAEIPISEIESVSGMPIYEIFLLWGKLNPQFAR